MLIKNTTKINVFIVIFDLDRYKRDKIIPHKYCFTEEVWLW